MSKTVIKKVILLAGSATFLVLGLKLLKKAAVIVILDSVDRFMAESEPDPNKRRAMRQTTLHSYNEFMRRDLNKREGSIRRPHDYYSIHNDRARQNYMEN